MSLTHGLNLVVLILIAVIGLLIVERRRRADAARQQRIADDARAYRDRAMQRQVDRAIDQAEVALGHPAIVRRAITRRDQLVDRLPN